VCRRAGSTPNRRGQTIVSDTDRFRMAATQQLCPVTRFIGARPPSSGSMDVYKDAEQRLGTPALCDGTAPAYHLHADQPMLFRRMPRECPRKIKSAVDRRWKTQRPIHFRRLVTRWTTAVTIAVRVLGVFIPHPWHPAEGTSAQLRQAPRFTARNGKNRSLSEQRSLQRIHSPPTKR